MAAAAAASGPVFLTSASAAAPVGKVVLGVPALPRCMATPLRAAAATTHATRAQHANYTGSPTLGGDLRRYRPGWLQVAPRGTAAHVDSQRDEGQSSRV